MEFATGLLEQAGVSITPGTAFGDHGEGYVRISLGMATERIQEAMDRMQRFFDTAQEAVLCRGE